MQRSLRNYLWVVHVVAILVVGLFLAMGINNFIASMVVEAMPGTPAEAQTEKKKPGPEQDEQQELALLADRNLFNQSAPSDEEEEEDDTEEVVEEPAAETADTGPAPGEPQATDLRVRLVGTRVASDKRYSMAILKDLDKQVSVQRRIGQTFMEDATILHIDRNYVYFKRHSKGNAVEFIELFLEESEIMARTKKKPDTKKNAKDSKTASRGRGGSSGRPTSRGSTTPPGQRVASNKGSSAAAGKVDPNAVRKMGSNKYGVPRDMAETVRQNPKILQDPRFGPPPQIQPVYKNQQIRGFRVNQVAKGSVYYKLGIRNGDVVLDVNGKMVDNPQKALAFFDELGPNSAVKLQVNRKGRPTTITYQQLAK